MFETKQVPETAETYAPDGSEVRTLLRCSGGSMAHFRLAANQISRAIRHRTVDEIWYIVAGQGEMWRACGDTSALEPLKPGTALTIPCGTAFQFRAANDHALEAIAITLPPWPGNDEACIVPGYWPVA